MELSLTSVIVIYNQWIWYRIGQQGHVCRGIDKFSKPLMFIANDNNVKVSFIVFDLFSMNLMTYKLVLENQEITTANHVHEQCYL